jgi:hypothetical protein
LQRKTAKQDCWSFEYPLAIRLEFPWNDALSRPLFSTIHLQGLQTMSSQNGKWDGNLWLASAMIVAGLALYGLSLVEITKMDRAAGTRIAQATPPLQGSPAAPASDVPAESKPGGTRPTTPAPEPARPDAQAQQEGAKAALPPAPPEKIAPPMPAK